LEEERRLCFVGITRAQQRLILSTAARRTIRGLSGPTIISQFLAELPKEHLEIVKQAQTTMDYADAQHSPFRIGQSVKHPTLGIGKIVDLPPSRAVVDFPVSGRKTLLLEYARLQPVS